MAGNAEYFAKLLCLMCILVFVCYTQFETITSAFAPRILAPCVEDATVFTYKNYKREKNISDYNLNHMEYITRLNSDPLPSRTNNLTAAELCSIDDTNCLPAIPVSDCQWKIVPKYKLATCVVQKSMSTVMLSIMCFLAHEEEYRASGSNFSDPRKWKLCVDNFATAISQIHAKYKTSIDDPTWKYLAVTRDPVDRFLSGFVDKCIRNPISLKHCNNCYANMTCFLIKEYEHAKSVVNDGSVPNSYEDRHFLPQSWKCGMVHLKERMSFIRYSSDPSQGLLDELKEQLTLQNVSQDRISFIENRLITRHTVHATITSPARRYLEERLRSSPFLMEYIVKLFYIDYITLGYELPDI